MNSKLPIQEFIQIDPSGGGDDRSEGGLAPVPMHRLFVVYNACRTLLAVALLSLLIIPNSSELISQFDRTMFVTGSSALLLSALLIVGKIGRVLYAIHRPIFLASFCSISPLLPPLLAPQGALSAAFRCFI